MAMRDELILVPFIVQFNLLSGLGNQEMTGIAKAKQQFIRVAHVGWFFLKVFSDLVDMF
jgi:hypothetical protein